MGHIIKNFDLLATSPLRTQALNIAEAGFAALNTEAALNRSVKYNFKSQILSVQGKKYDLKNYKRVLCVGIGKVAVAAAEVLERILKDRISAGLVIDLRRGFFKKIISRIGTHPFPSEQNVKATKEIMGLLEGLMEKDLVIAVVSGGGSSLFCYPYDLSLKEQTDLTKALMDKGANITELNTVRKHVSRVKGGNLAKICFPATVVGLLFSDVPGNDLSTIASGPTVLDETTVADAAEVLKKYDVLEQTNLDICHFYETPKDLKYFERVNNFLVLSSGSALEAMKEKAEELDFKVKIFSDHFQGEARGLGPQIINSIKPSQCLIGAGESTVKVVGHGIGGRNQEMALSALTEIRENQVLLCLASDGQDNSNSAGAVVDSSISVRAKNLNLNPIIYLDNNDSYSFFTQVGGEILTGLTGINVSDFFVCLKE